MRQINNKRKVTHYSLLFAQKCISAKIGGDKKFKGEAI